MRDISRFETEGFRKKSIRDRVVKMNGLLIVGAMLLMTIFITYLAQRQITEQTHRLLANQASSLHQRLEQRIGYLVENTKLLTTNKLMVNALTDAQGRERYLTHLTDNFMKGKDVISLNVVDFGGEPIFQTQKHIPRYNESPQLRAALALGETAYYMQQNGQQLVVVAPIKYYDTTQGAIVVVFSTVTIAQRTLMSDESSCIKLIHKNHTIFEKNRNAKEEYHLVAHRADKTMFFTHELDISLEIGLPTSIYNAPLRDTLLVLALVGVLFIALGSYGALVIGKTISAPILELYRRVKASDERNDVLCSPLGTDDELEELAAAFDERTLKLQYQAQHDALTQLPNRVLFIDRLQQAVKSAQLNEEQLAVIFIDLDRFKEVNDSFGHEFGDQLLKLVAQKLNQTVRGSDSVARLGGDEFILLLDDISDETFIIDTVQKIMGVFKESFDLKKRQLYITGSMGIAVYPQHGLQPDELIKNADAAMYKAKDDGRNTYHFYTDDMTQKALERVTLESQMRQGIIRGEFEPYYQLQVEMQSEKIVGMESLARWNHPQQGLVPPGSFIPLAEETGMIVEIDRHIMKRAMQQFVSWQSSGLDPGILSLNLSMVQLNQSDFIDEIKKMIALTGIATSRLIFEITETQIMRNPEYSILVLKELKKLGVKLAIDDFGTGHSSLSYLKRLPVDKIKVDQSFVRDIPEDKDDMIVTQAIIALSKSLGLSIIAEGVETPSQAYFLMKNDCFEAQGFLYYRPESGTVVTEVLKKAETKE